MGTLDLEINTSQQKVKRLKEEVRVKQRKKQVAAVLHWYAVPRAGAFISNAV